MAGKKYCGCCGTMQEADAVHKFLEWNDEFGDYLCPECEMGWEDWSE